MNQWRSVVESIGRSATLLCCGCFISVQLYAQTGQARRSAHSGALTGFVFVDSKGVVTLGRLLTPSDGALAAGNATVSVASVSTKTDGTGAFTLKNIPAGSETLHVATAAGPTGDFPVTIFSDVTAQLGAPAITRAAALAAVMKSLASIRADQKATIIMGPQEPLPTGTKVVPAFGDDKGQPSEALNHTARSEQWFIFVDPNVVMRYQHPVVFFFVDAWTGALTRLDETSWPFINGVSFYGRRDADLKSPDLMNGPNLPRQLKPVANGPTTRAWPAILSDQGTSTSQLPFETADRRIGAHLLLAGLVSAPAFSSRLIHVARTHVPQPPTNAPAGGGGTTYALIIEGSDESDQNADVQNITGLFGQGGIPPASVQFSKPSNDAGLNGPGKSPRKDDLKSKFKQQCDAAQPGDTLFIYITGHSTNGGGIQLDSNGVDQFNNPVTFETLTVVDFNFSGCQASNVVVIIDACYSAKMAAQFQSSLEQNNFSNFTVISSSDSTHPSRGIPSWEQGFYWVFGGVPGGLLAPPTGGVFTNQFISAFNNQVAANPTGTVDLTQTFLTTKIALNNSWLSNVPDQNPQIFVHNVTLVANQETSVANPPAPAQVQPAPGPSPPQVQPSPVAGPPPPQVPPATPKPNRTVSFPPLPPGDKGVQNEDGSLSVTTPTGNVFRFFIDEHGVLQVEQTKFVGLEPSSYPQIPNAETQNPAPETSTPTGGKTATGVAEPPATASPAPAQPVGPAQTTPAPAPSPTTTPTPTSGNNSVGAANVPTGGGSNNPASCFVIYQPIPQPTGIGPTFALGPITLNCMGGTAQPVNIQIQISEGATNTTASAGQTPVLVDEPAPSLTGASGSFKGIISGPGAIRFPAMTVSSSKPGGETILNISGVRVAPQGTGTVEVPSVTLTFSTEGQPVQFFPNPITIPNPFSIAPPITATTAPPAGNINPAATTSLPKAGTISSVPLSKNVPPPPSAPSGFGGASCSAFVAIHPNLRVEGETELLKDIDFNCTGALAPNVNGNITVNFIGANIKDPGQLRINFPGAPTVTIPGVRSGPTDTFSIGPDDILTIVNRTISRYPNPNASSQPSAAQTFSLDFRGITVAQETGNTQGVEVTLGGLGFVFNPSTFTVSDSPMVAVSPSTGGAATSAATTGVTDPFAFNTIPAGLNPATGTYNVTGNSLYAPGSAIRNAPIKVTVQYVAADGTIHEFEITLPTASSQLPPQDPIKRWLPQRDRPNAADGWGGSLQLAAFHSSDPSESLPWGTLVRMVTRPRPEPHHASKATPQAAGAPEFNLIANGNASGEAFEFQVFDSTGKLKEIRVPDGLILEPLERGSVQPVAAKPGEKKSSHKLSAYCVNYDKDAPEPNGLYRIAAPEIQEQYKPIRSVIRAGRELAAAGKFHPDSDPAAYILSIRQYALWSKLENWNEQQFADVFVEKTRRIAAESKVEWNKDMEQAIRALVPGRWRDISLVLEEARKLEAAPAPPPAR